MIGTEEEFDRVLDFLRQPKDKKSKSFNFKNEKDLANFFLTGKTHIVIIKKGRRGSIAYQKKKKLMIIPGGIFHVKLTKNFGAGDAFAGTFCYYYFKKQNIAQALMKVSVAAAIVVSQGSCTEAMPTEKELLKFIKAHPYQI